jgi:metal-dependent amidase/aminoacylase/carboxypeptidase family protein
MLGLYEQNAAQLVGQENLVRLTHRTGSTDMGDVSQIMPVIHPYVVAAEGNGHGDDYIVTNYELGVITGAKGMAMTVIDLLSDDARLANKVKEEYDAPMTKDQYLSLMRSMFHEGSYIE